MTKIKEIALVTVILTIMAVLVTISFAQSPQPVTRPQPIKDLRDFLLQPPDKIYRDYGYNENTLVLFNIARLVEISRVYEKRIAVLEKQLLVIDVNDVNDN